MDKLTIHKSQGEIFKCQFKVEGASVKDTSIRLCLEFADNKNMFFYGQIEESGECVVEIPKLKEIEQQNGKLVVEAIVDSIYFKLYEADVELINPVEVSMVKSPITKKTAPQTVVKMEGITTIKNPPPLTENVSPPKKIKSKQDLPSFEKWKHQYIDDDDHER